MANLKTQGEWGFLNRLLPRLRRLGRGRFLVPPGDDAAVLKNAARAVLSIDGLTDGTHFKSSWASSVKAILGVGLGRALGWKLLGSGLSDLAAMGRTKSRWAMVYLAAPSNTSMDFLMDLQKGVGETAQACGTALAGGDTVRGRDLSLVVAVGGDAMGTPLTRTGAKSGDLLCVTGFVGDADMGLRYLLKKKPLNKSDRRYFVERFFKATPLFKEGEVLASTPGVTALMDLSDPLGSSVNILTAASGVGAQISVDDIPVSPRLKKIGVSPVSLLEAGEDYGLLFTIRPGALAALRKKMKLTVIGNVRPRAYRVRFYSKGKQVRKNEFFEHFA